MPQTLHTARIFSYCVSPCVAWRMGHSCRHLQVLAQLQTLPLPRRLPCKTSESLLLCCMAVHALHSC